jgi:hypothetical protein
MTSVCHGPTLVPVSPISHRESANVANERRSDMPSNFTPEQVERIKGFFVDCCRFGKEIGIDNVKLAGALSAFAERLAGPTSDNSPLDRYINNPNGDNPGAKPV